jgi:hypothetical protein
VKPRNVYASVPDRSGLYRLRPVRLPATGAHALREQLERLAKVAADIDELDRRLPPAKGGRR